MKTKDIKTTALSCLLTLTIGLGAAVSSNKPTDEEFPESQKITQSDAIGTPDIFHTICSFSKTKETLSLSLTCWGNYENKDAFVKGNINMALKTLNTTLIPFGGHEHFFEGELLTSTTYHKMIGDSFQEILNKEKVIFVNPHSIFSYLLAEYANVTQSIKIVKKIDLFTNPDQNFDTIVEMHLLGSVDIYGVETISTDTLDQTRCKILQTLAPLKKQRRYVEFKKSLKSDELKSDSQPVDHHLVITGTQLKAHTKELEALLQINPNHTLILDVSDTTYVQNGLFSSPDNLPIILKHLSFSNVTGSVKQLGNDFLSFYDLGTVDFLGLSNLTTIGSNFCSPSSIVALDTRGLTSLKTIKAGFLLGSSVGDFESKDLINVTEIDDYFIGGATLVNFHAQGLRNVTKFGSYFLKSTTLNHLFIATRYQAKLFESQMKNLAEKFKWYVKK